MSDSPSISPRVSVIIPCYKQAQYLSGAIDSALSQVGVEAEVIVVNDGSPDETGKVAAHYAGRIVYIEQENRGLPAARNAGLPRATGEFVIFLDSDDLLPPETAVRQIEALRAAAGDVAICSYTEIDTTGQLGAHHTAPHPRRDMFHALLLGNQMPPVCFCVRRGTLVQAGEFAENPTIHGLEDWDLWLRLARGGARFCWSGADVFYRTYPTSMSHNIERMFHGTLHELGDMAMCHAGCRKCDVLRRMGRWIAHETYLVKWKRQFRRPMGRSRLKMMGMLARELILHPRLVGALMVLARGKSRGSGR